MTWQHTHGKTLGFYKRVGNHEVYVRPDRETPSAWSVYVDGREEAYVPNERAVALAEADLVLRDVFGAGAAGVAAPAK